MLKRALTTIVGLPIVLFLVHFGGVALAIFCGAIAIFGLRELYHAISGGYKPIHLVGYAFTGIYIALIYVFGLGSEAFLLLVLFMVVVQSCLVIFFNKLELKDCLAVVYGAMYVPLLLAFLILVRQHGYGNFYIWIVFASAFGCDTFAYLVGVTMGKYKLKNSPSPIKSVEGLFGGILGAAAVGFLYGFFVVQFSSQFEGMQFIIHATVFSAIGAVFCIFGDMAASAIKRNTKIKDFGNVFPGHGGFMDRIDSLLFVAPAIYVMMWLVIR